MHLLTIIIRLLSLALLAVSEFKEPNLTRGVFVSEDVEVKQGAGVSENVEVQLTTGTIRGRRNSRHDGVIDTFLGVPFAQPPIGPLRFQPPKPALPWKGVRNATLFPPMCPQHSKGSGEPWYSNEDCLFLNVYRPQVSPASRLPVLVWIHGGAYTTGTSSFYNGTELASRGVIVIAINYRLGALGFLSTSDSNCPGNNGLRDQILALQWVQDNARALGGDPKNVTIAGESAGAGSVSLLRLSPMAKGLFSKTIQESGSAFSPWAVGLASSAVARRQTAMAVGQAAGCGGNLTSAALLACLRNLSPDVILNASATVKADVGQIPLKPVVDGLVLPSNPFVLLALGTGCDVTSIRGINRDEWGYFLLETPKKEFNAYTAKYEVNKLVKDLFPSLDATSLATNITDRYFPENLTTPEQFRLAFIKLYTDLEFVVPTLMEVQACTEKARAGAATQFLYYFTYRAQNSTFPSWSGVMHASELPFVFGQPFSHDKFFARSFPFAWTEDDATVSGHFLDMWTRFALTGNPSLGAGGSWAAYTPASPAYLDIGLQLDMGKGLVPDAVAFWAPLLARRQ